ncbi:hypothetical protein EDC63_13037 [Sulfurirhabdus autotrophica]|uniref:Uncharacterized protein n=1 Tax=Sulfurirhabdus autotrophica TaxID=1706046 RepID=A0A4R3XVC6_9PROT|nr:hypothetical protein EDC63_13037 [Sulfurirhabdus autotrophica]
MSTIQDLFQQAQLAEAAYANIAVPLGPITPYHRRDEPA